MPESFHVRVAKREHVFCAAHFITIGDHCERLHGHNYHLAAEVSGPLSKDGLVVDFLFVRDRLQELAAELDHFVLLPTKHPQLEVRDDGAEVTVLLGKCRWSFPSGNCRLLPVENTTAELLAAYLGGRLADALAASKVTCTRLRIELDECDGQVAVWER
jgi:6-pyruvoyltetrahydropterin/6-carboxytetrahydropterin synthase